MPPSVASTSSPLPSASSKANVHISSRHHNGFTTTAPPTTDTQTTIKSRKPKASETNRCQGLSRTGPGKTLNRVGKNHDSDATRSSENNYTTTNNNHTATDDATPAPTAIPTTNPYSMIPYTGGMYGSPYYGGAMMMTGAGGGPFSGLYQVIFGVQNVVFSLTQAVQLLGTNQHALQQALDSLTGMIDHALATFQELRALEMQQIEHETEEQRRRRQRLKILRWSLMVGSSWLLYKIIRRLTSITGRRRRIDAGGTRGSILGQIMPYAGGTGSGAGSYPGHYNNSAAWNSMNGGVGYGSSLGMGMPGMNPYGGSFGGPSYY